MSYLVLARKYRPRNFSEMVGQEHVVQALGNALTTQRLHHAYMFTGTRGVGKTTVSRILAKSLNCQGLDGTGGITAEPCGVCQACQDIDSGRFVDYTELDAASNRGVDEVQSLLEQAVYKPVQGRFKVFMIDEVHMLTNTAFNAMLKTLEEPPEYLKFVLATTDPQKVPVTVLSRCLQFNLRPMAPETVLSHLRGVLAKESVEADGPSLALLSRAARGSMRDALSLTDQAIAFGGGKLQEAQVRQMLGSVDNTYVFRLIAALAQGDGQAVVETVNTLRQNGLNAASTLEEMSMVLQRMAVQQAVGAQAAPAPADDPDAGEIAALAEAMPADETQLLYSICLHGRAELGLAPDEYAALTMALLRLLAFKPNALGQAPGEKKTLNRPERAVSQAPAPSVVRPEAVPVNAGPVSPPVAATPIQSAAPVAEPPTVQPPAVVVAARPPVPAPAVAAPVTPIAAAPSRSEVPPWEDIPDEDPALAAPVPAPHTSQMLAMPVREQSESSERLRPRVDVAPGARPQAKDFVATPEGDFWHATVQQLIAAEAISAMTRELALQSQLLARNGGEWQLRVERESLMQPSCRERLRAALMASPPADGSPAASALNFEVGLLTDTPARRNAAAAQERLRVAEEILREDPFVQTMMRDFGAKIVPGSIKPL
ncbi:DNA polymerase III subunit gamma/tau [Variovorax sp. HJSM1_2]|uniref:DNA polymerase III subunit gamma/tau n=1 Tax=Variovorax sp. HJSM1_2 TaxID=3366263 RepID=UPI003BBE8F65